MAIYPDPMTLQLTAELEHQLAAVAEASACSPEEVATEAIQQFLADQAEHQQVITERRAEVAAGRVLDSHEVWARLQRVFQH